MFTSGKVLTEHGMLAKNGNQFRRSGKDCPPQKGASDFKHSIMPTPGYFMAGERFKKTTSWAYWVLESLLTTLGNKK